VCINAALELSLTTLTLRRLDAASIRGLVRCILYRADDPTVSPRFLSLKKITIAGCAGVDAQAVHLLGGGVGQGAHEGADGRALGFGVCEVLDHAEVGEHHHCGEISIEARRAAGRVGRKHHDKLLQRACRIGCVALFSPHESDPEYGRVQTER
jgi:hypothetical protein